MAVPPGALNRVGRILVGGRSRDRGLGGAAP